MHEEEEEQQLGLSMLTEPEKACPDAIWKGRALNVSWLLMRAEHIR